MPEPRIRFDDGAEYEDFMGKWSALAGEVFLTWLQPLAGLRWLDVGCGNGAFTERLSDRCAPRSLHGIDPSDSQIDFARKRLADRAIDLQIGEAAALPYADAAFDAAVMALVVFFVPDPAQGVAEMARVVAPGGSVSAYAWDLYGGGFPFAALHEEMAALGSPPVWPPRPVASRIDVMQELWTGAGLKDIDTRQITVERTFADFETFWRIARTGPGVTPALQAMTPGDVALLERRLRDRLPAGADGRITCSACANAVQGRVAS